MFKRFLRKLTIPTLNMPKISFRLPKASLPMIRLDMPKVNLPSIKIPLKGISTVVGAINTALLVLLGGLGLFVSYINPIPATVSYTHLTLPTNREV